MTVLPHLILTPVVGMPSAQSLHRLEQELFANAIAMPSRRGGGALGHLALCLTPAEYLTVPGTGTVAFVPPIDPGPTVQYATGATSGIRRSNERAHDALVAEVQRYRPASAILVQQLIAAVERRFIYELQHHRWEFAHVKPVDVLTHLRTNYADVIISTSDDTADNRDTLKPPVLPSGERVWYCWSHGITFNANHQSSNCRNQKENHKCNATIRYPKGGFPINTTQERINNNRARARAQIALKPRYKTPVVSKG